MGETEDYDKSATPTAHASTHENGGSDEISVAGLAGTLADPQTPAAHKTSHQDGGTDEISVAGLAGTLADAQTPAAHKTSHQDGGSDEISVAGLSGHLADAQDPTGHHTSHEPGGSDILAALAPAAHKTSHENGGSDEISVAGLAGLLVTAQTPAAHKTSHEDGGSDEISVAGLAGLLVTAQTPAAHKTSHQDGGSDEISVAGLAGTLADDQHVLDTEVETVITARQKARAYRNAAQSINNITWTKVGIDTDSFDPSGITDLVNNRIIPTKAGYYMVTGQVEYGSILVGCYCWAAIYVNGNATAYGNRCYNSITGAIGGVVSDIVYCDGIDDYVELWTYQNQGSASALYVAYSVCCYIAIVGPF